MIYSVQYGFSYEENASLYTLEDKDTTMAAMRETTVRVLRKINACV